MKKADWIDLKIVKLPIPRWTRPIFGVMVVVFLTTVSVLWIREKFFPPQDKTISFQLEMFKKHFGETPQKQVEIFNDQRGKLEVLYYQSDGALSAIRKSPDPRIQPSVFWIPNLERLSIPPPPSASGLEMEDNSSEGFAFAGGSGGSCIPIQKHLRQRYSSKISDCGKTGWCRLWLWWPDGCRGFYWIYPYSAGYYWELDNDGNPIFHWVACVH